MALKAKRTLEYLTGLRILALLNLDINSPNYPSIRQTAQVLFASEQTIYQWIRLFNEGDDSGNEIKGVVMHKNVSHKRVYEKFKYYSKAIVHFYAKLSTKNGRISAPLSPIIFRIINHDNLKFI